MEETKNEFHAKLAQAERERQQQVEQLTNEKEELRKQKDSQIRQLEREKEEQRNSYEIRINELELKIKCKDCLTNFCRITPDNFRTFLNNH